ncbi:transglycosylase SLT domain-containing protein [Nevskia soli]|uniref:transglycosylase SLT domain-containing protein n=1 Tax=Nevskia soli TaxID=418856 RepID=UPI0004A6AA30|nr:transglycosylase SLT domain-containing protein [Nevskia soli]
MHAQEIFREPGVLPAPSGWRLPSVGLCLLATLPLWAGLLLPWLPEQSAAQGKPGVRDPFALVFTDGHRLVCEGCRGLMGRLRQWALPVGAKPALTARAPARKPAAAVASVARHDVATPAVATRHVVSHYFGTGNFSDDVDAVLPQYRGNFEEAARRNGLDWRLLAAVGYQESRWNPAAESPTGVRGLMMLTTDTAQDLGVDREDGPQSILGAGRFLQGLYGQLPPQIREPDRTAMALAAYNQGIGHLMDARDVVINRGGDPDRWTDVRAALPLLSDADWQKTTKYGPARGGEAVAFVDGVRQYYARLSALAPSGARGNGLPAADSRTARVEGGGKT